MGQAYCPSNYLSADKSGQTVPVCICASGNVCVNGQPNPACG
ncbi:MAG TPA: hypothetical protein VNH11_29025 [Pirellulales bacterium]|nr:hypothetical protein [Pirellulales bacterium]